MVGVLALLLTLMVVQPAWGQMWWTPVHPGLAEARAQALMHPKHPIENPASPKQWGNSEGTGPAAPVPGTGRTPKFFGQVPSFDEVSPATPTRGGEERAPTAGERAAAVQNEAGPVRGLWDEGVRRHGEGQPAEGGPPGHPGGAGAA